LLPDSEVRFSTDDIKTFVCVQASNEDSFGEPVCVLGFLWTPNRGTVIRVGAPNREYIVNDVAVEFDASGLSQFVYIHELGG